MVASTSRVARKPAGLTMLCATPRLVLGFEVRAMSKPTTEPGPSAASTTTKTTSSQRGAGPDNDSRGNGRHPRVAGRGSRRVPSHQAKSASMAPNTLF